MLKQLFHDFVGLAGLEVRRKFHHTYFEDGLRTIHDSSFTRDPHFISAYEGAKSRTKGQEAYQGPWRVHIAMWAAQTALSRSSGDFIECGVWRGFVSCAAMIFVNWNSNHGNRTFFLVDSFQGLSSEYMTEEERKVGTHFRYGKRYENMLAAANETMQPFENVQIIKGWVPDILKSIPTKEVAYLHLDLNSAIPEAEALKFFWPKMTQGGVILFDDHSFHGYRPQKIALDDAAESLGVKIASLPTGQGLLIK
jgi:hypothetical protein